VSNDDVICYYLLLSILQFNVRRSPRHHKMPTKLFEPKMGPDEKWKDSSPFKTFDIELDSLKDVMDHKLFHMEQKREYERNRVFLQRYIWNFNRTVKDYGSGMKHRISNIRYGNLTKGCLQLLETDQEVLNKTLIAYEDCIHDLEDLQVKHTMLVRQLLDLGEVPVVSGGGGENPSEGEAENLSPQRNVNLETRFNDGAPSVAAASPMDDVEDDDDDSDRTVPLTPSPVKSVKGNAKASGSPAY